LLPILTYSGVVVDDVVCQTPGFFCALTKVIGHPSQNPDVFIKTDDPTVRMSSQILIALP
jgi:hypothetical protein